MDAVRAITNAVLYEGYLLWPYRRSALKNQRRWTFGGVYPQGHSERHPDDRSVMRTEVLVDGEDAVDDVRVRFLHVVRRQVLVDGLPVDEAVVDGRRHLSWEEATEREFMPGAIDVPAGSVIEQLDDDVAIERSWRSLEGDVEVSRRSVAPGLSAVGVTVRNTSRFVPGSREEALAQTFCSTHAVLCVDSGAFVSLTDPPPELAAAAAACSNEGAWPVLVGEGASSDTMLCSPIILEDHPRVAPESPGDLFDGGEVDELLVFNILSLTDEEKDEMRDSDPRAREILERTESLTPGQILRLHGARR